MGGGSQSSEEANLKGLSRHFNSVTIHGRANVAKLTYAVTAAIGVLIWWKPWKRSAGPPPTPALASGGEKECKCDETPKKK